MTTRLVATCLRVEYACARPCRVGLWVVAAVLAAVHFAVQVLVPLRHLAIPSNSVWSEEGSAGRG